MSALVAARLVPEVTEREIPCPCGRTAIVPTVRMNGRLWYGAAIASVEWAAADLEARVATLRSRHGIAARLVAAVGSGSVHLMVTLSHLAASTTHECDAVDPELRRAVDGPDVDANLGPIPSLDLTAEEIQRMVRGIYGLPPRREAESADSAAEAEAWLARSEAARLVVLAILFLLPGVFVAGLVDWRIALALLLWEGGQQMTRVVRTW